ncbi:MAG: MFS transporter, partial [Thermoguttaceae bacterium]
MTHTNDPELNETTLADVKQLGLWASIASLSYVFWIVGGMEMIERLAFYGVRSVATIYATRPVVEGGLGVTMAALGWLFLSWNLLQSLLSVCTGGLSDRYGYKETIFLSTILKCFGYLVMAWFPTYWGFFAGAMLLATGTAIFKPAIQGTLVKSTNRQNSSMAWGIFYQVVNIGGWVGPLIALQMRHMDWTYVFYTNAAFICLNFLLLLTYREPGKDERLARKQRLNEGAEKHKSLLFESLNELKKPVLLFYLIIFSVWWFMFMMLFDVLPKYIDDWVDTSSLVTALFGNHGTQNTLWHFLLGLSADGLRVEPEGIVNIDAGMIMIFCFLFAGLSAKMRATTSMTLGTLLLTAALCLLGLYPLVWFAILAIVIFSIGEMLTGPKFSEFLGNIAPPDKKAMWMGFSQAPILIGWTIEGKLGPQLYHWFSSKDVFARQMLVERGMAPGQVTANALPIGEAFQKLVDYTGQSPKALTRLLYASHHVGLTWYFFAAAGVCSAVMIYLSHRGRFRIPFAPWIARRPELRPVGAVALCLAAAVLADGLG